MTPVKLSRTSRSPTELLLVKSTMENASRQAHENNGVIFKPFTSHQIICANFFSHHSSYLPLACELGAPLAHEDTDLRNICGFRARHSGPKMGPNNNTTIKISAGFFRAWFLLGVWCREVQSAGGSKLFTSWYQSEVNWTSHLWYSQSKLKHATKRQRCSANHDHDVLELFV